MATLARGAVTLTPIDMLGWSLTRTSRTVVHDIIGDVEPDVTDRPPAPRRGSLRLLFASHDDAQAAAEALSVVGGPWEVDAGVVTMTALRVGDVAVDAQSDAGGAWVVTVEVLEAAS